MARDVLWHGTAETIFKEDFPSDLQDQFTMALQGIAAKKTPALANTMHGHPFGPDVWKLKAKDKAGQWRVVYVRGYEEAIYVVNAYQKKSPSGGSEEAPNDIKNTRERLYWAELEHKVYLAEKAKCEAEDRAKTKQAPKGKRKGSKR